MKESKRKAEELLTVYAEHMAEARSEFMDKEYKEVHEKLVEVIQEAVAKDESIQVPPDFDERFLERLKKENDPDFEPLIRMLEERIGAGV